MIEHKNLNQGHTNHLAPVKSAEAAVVFPTGSLISVPRADGAVQHVDWNNYLKNKGTLVPKWANRWMFLQDTLRNFSGGLSQEQVLNNEYNFGNARTMLGMMMADRAGLSTVGWTWLPYDESKGNDHRTAITDAVTFTDDFIVPKGTYAGQLSVGTWARDIPGLIPIWEQSNYWLNQNPPSTPFPQG